MSILNVTFAGRSADVGEIEFTSSDEDVKRIAAEIVSSDIVTWDEMWALPSAFSNFVVDRFIEKNRLYLRPKVPFGDA